MTLRDAAVDFILFPIGNTALSSRSKAVALVNDVVVTSSKKIGQLVRQRRRANQLTQRQLGELAGVGLRLISELERGKSTLRMDAANRVLAVFGLMLGPVEAPREEGQ